MRALSNNEIEQVSGSIVFYYTPQYALTGAVVHGGISYIMFSRLNPLKNDLFEFMLIASITCCGAIVGTGIGVFRDKHFPFSKRDQE